MRITSLNGYITVQLRYRVVFVAQNAFSGTPLRVPRNAHAKYSTKHIERFEMRALSRSILPVRHALCTVRCLDLRGSFCQLAFRGTRSRVLRNVLDGENAFFPTRYLSWTVSIVVPSFDCSWFISICTFKRCRERRIPIAVSTEARLTKIS